MFDKDILYSTIFNLFRENVINLSYINMNNDEYLDRLLEETNNKDEEFTSFCLLRKYLTETKPVDTYEEIIDILNINALELRNKYSNIFTNEYLSKILNKTVKDKLLKEDNKYLYFDSKNIYGKNENIKSIEKADYIITIDPDKYNLAPALVSILNNYNIPYKFKISKESNLIVLEIDNNNIDMYRTILEELRIRTIMIEQVIQENKNKPFQFIKNRFKNKKST